MKLRRSLSEFIEPCKTGCDHTKMAFIEGHEHCSIYTNFLSIYCLIYGKDVIFEGRGVSCIFTSNIQVLVLTFLFLRILRYSLFEGDSLQSQC